MAVVVVVVVVVVFVVVVEGVVVVVVVVVIAVYGIFDLKQTLNKYTLRLWILMDNCRIYAYNINHKSIYFYGS